ncbi:hypothetical protein Bca101_083142 [Brassica carinata]
MSALEESDEELAVDHRCGTITMGATVTTQNWESKFYLLGEDPIRGRRGRCGGVSVSDLAEWGRPVLRSGCGAQIGWFGGELRRLVLVTCLGVLSTAPVMCVLKEE